jgi:flagellar hook-basal body complex protein FliE
MAIQAVRDFTGRSEGAFRLQLPSSDPVASRTRAGGAPEVGTQPTFGDLVKDFAGDVNDLQFSAGDAINMLATGRSTDVHQVMIAVEEASVAMDLMLEIRNRVLEGYQELIRMQV